MLYSLSGPRATLNAALQLDLTENALLEVIGMSVSKTKKQEEVDLNACFDIIGISPTSAD